MLRIVDNFISQIISFIKTIAVVDLFDGQADTAHLKLILDYCLVLDQRNNQMGYPVRLSAKIRYTQDDRIRNSIVSVTATIYPWMWIQGPLQWQGLAETIALQLVSGLRVHLQHNYDHFTYLRFIEGDSSGLEPHMKRTFIKTSV
jgi:hypothetical protein